MVRKWYVNDPKITDTDWNPMVDELDKTLVDSSDTTSAFLWNKLSAGTGISLSVVNPSGNEKILITNTSSGGTPSGNSGDVQFNNSGNFGGDDDFYWDNIKKNLGIGTTSPTARLHLPGGAEATGKAPLKFTTTGALLDNLEAGAFESLNDDLYYTIPTGPQRTGVVLSEEPLSENCITFASVNGRLNFDGNLTFITDTLSTPKISTSEVILNSAAAYTTDGAIWNDSTYNCHSSFINGVRQKINTVLFVQSSPQTVVNTGSETTLIGSGDNTLTIPAFFFTPGKTIRIRGWGYYSTASISQGTLTIKVKIGSTVVSYALISQTQGITNKGWRIDDEFTCTGAGTSGSLWAQGRVDMDIVSFTTAAYWMTNTTPVAINTTNSYNLDVTATYSNPSLSNSITSTNFVFEVLD